MNYRFEVKATPFDFFKMSIKKTYRSPLGMCNIVFFAAAVLLTVKFYSTASPLAQALMVFMCILIPVVQPLGIYMRARSYALAIPEGLTLEVRESGIFVATKTQSDHVVWNKVSSLIDTGDCLVLKLTDGNGYFLFNRVLGDQRDTFKDYVKKQLQFAADKNK